MAEGSPDPRLAWLAAVTPDDLLVVGTASEDLDVPCGELLADWAQAFNVDLAQVHDCLRFLQSGPVLLHAPTLAVAVSFSPRRGDFRICLVGTNGVTWRSGGFARAGAWLTSLASELGALPTSADHRLALRLSGAEMRAKDVAAVDQYRRYARLVTGRNGDAADEQLGQHVKHAATAVWRCVAYVLR